MRVARLLSLAAVLACGLALPVSAAPCAGPAPRIRDAGKRFVGTWGGPEAYAGNLAAYLAAMRRAGWTRIVVGTELPSTWEPFDPERDTLNLILTAPGGAGAHGIDAIADFALSPEMGGDGQAADKTYFADGIHPTNLGYATLASIYGRALTQAMAKR